MLETYKLHISKNTKIVHRDKIKEYKKELLAKTWKIRNGEQNTEALLVRSDCRTQRENNNINSEDIDYFLLPT